MINVENGQVLCKIHLPIRFTALDRILTSMEQSYGRDITVVQDGEYLVLYKGNAPK